MVKKMLSQMNKETIDRHVGNLAADYVLDLLPQEEKRSIAHHLSQCIKCRQVVAAEERIGLLVRSTVEASGQSQAELRSIMPQVPARRAGLLGNVTFRQQLVIAGLFLVMFLAGFNLMFEQQIDGFTAPLSTAYVATASHTHTPTAVTSSPTPRIRANEASDQAVPIQNLNQPLITPAPSALEAR
jgi:anti-sigma-K factor RskA